MENGYIYQNETTTKSTKKLVHIRMLAAPINPADINQIQGTYPLTSPGTWHVAGNEGVGQVMAVGSDVESLKVGDWVIPNSGALGTWREQLFAREDDLQSVPNDLPIEVATSLVVNPPTAYRMLEDFVSLRPNDIIVQNGANSAVGRYVIQLARLKGVRTINIVRDRPDYESLEQELRSLGATMVIRADKFALPETQRYLIELLSNQRPILGLNCVSGLATIDMANFLADGSPLVTYGGMSHKNPIVTTSALIFRDIRFVGFWMSRWYNQARENSILAMERQQMMENIIEMFKKDQLAVPNFEKFKFADQWTSAIGYYSDNSKMTTTQSKPLFVM